MVSPDPAGVIAADWAASAFPRGAYVYRDHAILWRTARELVARPAEPRPRRPSPADILLNVAAGYWPDQAWPDEGIVPTRLARVEDGRLVPLTIPLHPEPDFRLAWALSEVSVT